MYVLSCGGVGSFLSLFLFGVFGNVVFILLKPKLSRIVLLCAMLRSLSSSYELSSLALLLSGLLGEEGVDERVGSRESRAVTTGVVSSN